MTGKPFLTELLAGLDGVTRGEWAVDGFNLGGVIRRAPGKTHVSDWRHLAVCQSENVNWRKDAAHIARCSPDRIRAIGEYVEQIERERDEAREEFATVAKANKEIAEWWQEADSRAYALEQKLKVAREAAMPLAILKIPKNPLGNAAAYSIRYSDIERARALFNEENDQ